MISQAGDLARRLARDAEAVCRHYLSRGCRRGHYWVVGDVSNNAGRSLYVRLSGPDSGPGAAGKWTDAATGEHGDLLDLIARNRDLPCFADAIEEARSFLALPRTVRAHTLSSPAGATGSSEAARRLFRAGVSVPGTPAEAYLRARGITAPLNWPALRFHPRVYYRDNEQALLETWPALLSAVTDLGGHSTGVQRTWLDRNRPAKAPLANPRRALGQLLGNGVRFDLPDSGFAEAGVLAVGEGIETMLSLVSVLPGLPMIAGLSANHLAALAFAPSWRRLYVARDNDAAGIRAAERLHERGHAAGIEVRDLVPIREDFNLDLRRLGPLALLAHLVTQLIPSDAARFLPEKHRPA